MAAARAASLKELPSSSSTSSASSSKQPSPPLHPQKTQDAPAGAHQSSPYHSNNSQTNMVRTVDFVPRLAEELVRLLSPNRDLGIENQQQQHQHAATNAVMTVPVAPKANTAMGNNQADQSPATCTSVSSSSDPMLMRIVEAMLVHFAELAALLDAAEENVEMARATLPRINEKREDIRALFARIDALQSYVDTVDATVTELEAATSKLGGGGPGFAGAAVQASVHIGKVFSSLWERVAASKGVSSPSDLKHETERSAHLRTKTQMDGTMPSWPTAAAGPSQQAVRDDLCRIDIPKASDFFSK